MPKTTYGKVTVPHISAVRGIESIVVGIYKLVGALMAADQQFCWTLLNTLSIILSLEKGRHDKITIKNITKFFLE